MLRRWLYIDMLACANTTTTTTTKKKKNKRWNRDILDGELDLLMNLLNLLVREQSIHGLPRYPRRDQKTDPSLRVREKRTRLESDMANILRFMTHLLESKDSLDLVVEVFISCLSKIARFIGVEYFWVHTR